MVCFLLIQDSRGGKVSTSWAGLQRTKKVNCPASLQVRGISLFTDYMLDSEYSSVKALKKAKARIMKQLKADIQMGRPLKTTTRYYFRLALSTSHKSHPVGAEATTVGQSV